MVHNGAYLGAKTSQNEPEEYHCEKCDYTTSKLGNWKRHIKTKKHNGASMVHNGAQKGAKTSQSINVEKDDKTFVCDCGKAYKYHQGLYRHKKICTWTADCNVVEPKTKTLTTVVKETTKENDFFDTLTKEELKGICKYQKKLEAEASSHSAGIGTSQAIHGNNNTMNNQNFNISVFLNEKCSDAMSIQDFAKQLTLTMEDLAQSRQNRALGFSNIVVKNLEPLAITERPVHCTDDQGWFVKDGANWEEDNGGKLIAEAQKGIQRTWPTIFEDANPGWENKDGLKEAYCEIAGAATSDLSIKELSKITKTVGKRCGVKDK